MQSKKESAPKAANMVEIDGAFGCNYCTEVADRALYDPNRNFVIWECPGGHKNKMEDVHLG